MNNQESTPDLGGELRVSIYCVWWSIERRGGRFRLPHGIVSMFLPGRGVAANSKHQNLCLGRNQEFQEQR